MSQTLQFLFHTYNTQSLTGLLETCCTRCRIHRSVRADLPQPSPACDFSTLIRPTFIRTGLIFSQNSSGVIYTRFSFILTGRRLQVKRSICGLIFFFFFTLPFLVKTGPQELPDLEELWEYLTAITHRRSANKTCFSCFIVLPSNNVICSKRDSPTDFISKTCGSPHQDRLDQFMQASIHSYWR